MSATLIHNELEQKRPGRLARFLARLCWRIGLRTPRVSAVYLRELKSKSRERTPEIPFLRETIAGEDRPLDYHLQRLR